MDDVDGGVDRSNGPRVADSRRKSGMVSSPHAGEVHWAEIATAAEFLVMVLRRVEQETGDRDVRTIIEGVEDLVALSRERAHGRAPEGSG